MSSVSPRVRLLGGLLLAVALLLAGAVVALAGPTADCNSWTDPKGDSTTGQRGVPGTEDSQLDIVGASFGTVGENIVGTITTAGLSSGSSDAGDEFRFSFTVAGVRMLMYVDRTAPDGVTVDVTAGFFNRDNTNAPGGAVTAVFDVKTKTVTLTGKVSELAKSVTKPVLGQEVSVLVAETFNQVAFGSLTPAAYDKAPTTIKPVVGTECGASSGGGAASPTPSASASPSASGSPSPSASASPAPSGSATASPAPSGAAGSGGDGPTPGCTDITDPKGDASPNATNPGAPTPNDPDLDILAVNFRTEPDTISGYLKIDKLGTKPALGNGHRFDMTFTAGGKVVEIYGGQPDAVAGATNAALVAAGVSAPAAGGGRLAGTYNAGIKTKTVFDVKASRVVLSVDRASLAKVVGNDLADGTVLTLTSAHSRVYTPTAGSLLADTAQAAKPDEQVYTLGDNRCFVVETAPAAATATSLIVSAPRRVQVGDRQPVTVTLRDGDQPRAGASVSARLGNGTAAAGRTDGNGRLRLQVPIPGPAGTKTLVVTYAGDENKAGAATVRRSVTVLPERSLLTYTTSGSGDTRLLTITLIDDDEPTRHPYANVPVTFGYEQRYTTVRTDRRGQAFLRVRTGTKVDMDYAGRSGYVTSAKRRTTVD